MTTPNTHLKIDPRLCGEPVALAPGEATTRFVTTAEMGADAEGLVHGGFVFGLADYAAMLAVNDPNVVLGAAEVRFTAPVKVGDEVVAAAKVIEEKGKKRVIVPGTPPSPGQRGKATEEEEKGNTTKRLRTTESAPPQ